jgi:hypothetical protein
VLGDAERGAQGLLRESGQRRRITSDFDGFWDDALARGVIDGTTSSPEPAAMQWNALATPLAVLANSPGATHRGQSIALHTPLADYVAAPDFTRSQRGGTLALYRPHEYTGDRWAMTIDLGVSTRCSACVVPCQAETIHRWPGRAACAMATRCNGCASTVTPRVIPPTRAPSRCPYCAITARRRRVFRRGSFRSLLAALALGIAFLVLEAIEYRLHIRDGIVPGHLRAGAPLSGRGADLFFTLNYFMTGLHALHVIVGLGIIGWLAWRTRRLAFDAEYHTPLELGGMYWHFVDIIWLFLRPIFYLLR